MSENDLKSEDWGSTSKQTIWSAKVGSPINEQNRSVFLVVAIMLGLTSLIALGGVIVLAYIGKDIPQALIAIGSVAITALGSLFTNLHK